MNKTSEDSKSPLELSDSLREMNSNINSLGLSKRNQTMTAREVSKTESLPLDDNNKLIIVDDAELKVPKNGSDKKN